MQKVGLLASAATVGILAGSMYPGAATTQRKGEFSTPDVKEFVQTEFDEGVTFWRKRDVGSAALAQLVYLEGSASTICTNGSDQREITAGMNSEYCLRENKVALTAISVNSQLAFGAKTAGVKFLINHEIGHWVDEQTGHLGTANLDAMRDTPASAQDFELRANCYAGAAMQATATPAEVTAVASYLNTLGEADETHGSGEQQSAAFLHGAKTQSCL